MVLVITFSRPHYYCPFHWPFLFSYALLLVLVFTSPPTLPLVPPNYSIKHPNFKPYSQIARESFQGPGRVAVATGNVDNITDIAPADFASPWNFFLLFARSDEDVYKIVSYQLPFHVMWIIVSARWHLLSSPVLLATSFSGAMVISNIRCLPGYIRFSTGAI